MFDRYGYHAGVFIGSDGEAFGEFFIEFPAGGFDGFTGWRGSDPLLLLAVVEAAAVGKLVGFSIPAVGGEYVCG